jgi:threonine dehydrogenase-like Zn-dependent dehydrogenase
MIMSNTIKELEALKAIEAAGAATAVKTAQDLVKRRGRIVIAGFQTTPFSVSGETFWDKELTIKAVRATGPSWVNTNSIDIDSPSVLEYIPWNSRSNFKEACRLVSTKKVKGEHLITHRFKAEKIKDAYAMLDKNSADSMHVTLDWR